MVSLFFILFLFFFVFVLFPVNPIAILVEENNFESSEFFKNGQGIHDISTLGTKLC